MTLTVMLPMTFKLDAIDKFSKDVVAPDGNPRDSVYLFDFARLNFIDGSGYTVLSNTLAWLQSHKVVCRFTNYANLTRLAIVYLDDCGFFRQHLGGVLRRGSSLRETTLPCTHVENARAFSWIEHQFSPWAASILGVTYGNLSSLRSCLKEVFNNIGDHSSKNTGFVHAQHYPTVRHLKITVSDFGVGIPNTIRRSFGDMSDAAAIAHAAKEGVTSQSRPNNMGAGLNYLIDRVTDDDGSVLIHSLSGNLACYTDRNRQIRKPSVGRGTYPGTLVDITLDTRLFVGDDDDDRGEVEW
jgi:anti-sigma regulatory factor (Ser/Thr protein kinase)